MAIAANMTREFWEDLLPPHWQVREGTWDGSLFDAVVVNNEYGIGWFGPEDVVVDVGAHIGSFSWLAAQRGAKVVYSFEADPENFEMLVANTNPVAANVICENVAVWRSDFHRGPRHLNLRKHPYPPNTGGADVFGDDGPVVEVLPFDDVIEEGARSSERKRVRLVKMDCEGSEFPILFTSKKLRKIEEIVGEFHLGKPHIEGMPEFTERNLRTHLRSLGFQCWTDMSDDEVGSFRAVLKEG